MAHQPDGSPVTKLPILVMLMAVFAASGAHAGAPAVQPNAPANIAALDGVTVTGKRCTLATKGCACRETDVACIRAVADDMRLYFPKQYLAMASRCLKEDMVMAQMKIAFANDPEAQRQPGYFTEEAASHKTFCDKAYADAPAVKAALKARGAQDR